MPRDATARGPKGERTRRAILDRSAALATQGGLESLSIGGLAEELGMSKSGLFAHFGSKEELQLATVERAREIFKDEVIEPTVELPEGMEHLRALCDRWLSYVEREVFPGGCFFSKTSSEFANRPGPVKDRLAVLLNQWLRLIEKAARGAQRAGEMERDIDPARLAFELIAIAETASRNERLLGERAEFTDARAAIFERLGVIDLR